MFHCLISPIGQYFNPRPPRGGRQFRGALGLQFQGSFQPTPSSRRATSQQAVGKWERGISTHALLAEGDVGQNDVHGLIHDFNPRPPRGGRLTEKQKRAIASIISTHALLAEGDNTSCVLSVQDVISTHALLAEGDGGGL